MLCSHGPNSHNRAVPLIGPHCCDRSTRSSMPCTSRLSSTTSKIKPMDAWTALALQPHIGVKTLRALVSHFGSAEAVLEASPGDLKQVSGVGSVTAKRIAAINLDD